MKDIHIVIVNYKMKDDIDRCLQTLQVDIQRSGLDVSVVVVDNSKNSDGIKDLINESYPDVSYHDAGGNIGFGKANNQGLLLQDARYYFVLNPDTQFLNDTKSILYDLYTYMESTPDVGIVTPKLLNNDGSIQYSCNRFPKFLDQPLRRLNIEDRFNWIKRRVNQLLMTDFDHNSIIDIDWAIGAALFVRSQAIAEVGMFDDQFFMYFEDCDWCRRMWKHGWRVVYNAEIILHHGHRRQSADVPGIMAVLKSPLTRIHIASWLKYFWKWRMRRK